MGDMAIRALNMKALDSVTDIHINAFSDSALTILGWKVVRRYYEWLLHDSHDAVALGVFQNERLMGFCFAGIFREALTGFLQKNKAFLIWRIIAHPWLVVTPFFRERINLAWNLLKRRSSLGVPQPVISMPKSFGILSIAVDTNNQGMGLGKRLMAEIERIALERGFSQLHLTVDINNIQAIGFYQNLGWQKKLAPDGLWRGSMIKKLLDIYE